MPTRILWPHEATKSIIRAFYLIVTILLAFKVVVRYTYGFPLLIEGVLQIILSEVNHRKQTRRYRQFEQQGQDCEGLGEEASRRTECVGAVIGYREDPVIFRKCLESYRDDSSCAVSVLVVGIDGNEAEDLQMIGTVEKVCRSLPFPRTRTSSHRHAPRWESALPPLSVV